MRGLGSVFDPPDFHCRRRRRAGVDDNDRRRSGDALAEDALRSAVFRSRIHANLTPMYIPLTDRYLYLSMVGLALIAARLLIEIPPVLQRRVAGGLAARLALWAAANLQRQCVWQDRVRLWEDTLNKNPLSCAAANNRGFAFFERGQIREALAAWKDAVQIHPQYANIWLGIVLAEDALGNTPATDTAWRVRSRRTPSTPMPTALVTR